MRFTSSQTPCLRRQHASLSWINRVSWTCCGGYGKPIFFLDEGMVLTAARSRNPVGATREMFSQTQDEIGDVSIYIRFECILRRLDAEQHQFAREMSELYRNNRVVGYHTYGEQYGSMHVNQTLTGVAIGRRRA